jgi:glycine oxidase
MRNVARASDIVVIGAGIIGCAIARELAARGASVSMLDGRGAGSGATHASGGMLAPYTEAADAGPLLALGVRSLALFDDLVRAVEGETQIAVGYRRNGTLHIAHGDATLAEFEALASVLRGLNVAAERLSASQARALEPNLADDLSGGLLISTQGLLSAPDFARALLVSAQRHGARLLEPTPARRITPRDGGIAVTTDRGIVEARTVVLAAGAWSGQIRIDGVDSLPVRPVRGQLLHLKWAGTPVSRITWDEHCYLVPWADGTLLVGATVEEAGFDEHATVGGVRGLLDAVSGLFPAAGRAELLSVRVGLRPAGPDALPIIGWSDVVPGLMYATGHYRNGVLLAPLTAQLVADAIVDHHLDHDLSLTVPGRIGRL